MKRSTTTRFVRLAALLSLLHHGITTVSSLAAPSRRDILIAGGGSLAGIAIGNGGGGHLFSPAPAFAASSVAPVAVIGAGGRTGALCVAAFLERGLPVRALTRSGEFSLSSSSASSNLLSTAACDVKDQAAIEAAVKGCRGVIYAASASKKGGSAKEIDNDGVAAAGEACLKAKVGRYVVISSTATTRPRSAGYMFTNVMGGIMAEKRTGEERVRASYGNKDPSASSYTIVRPGGLEEPKKNEVLGPSALEISQGDTLAGIISRADLAQVAVELAVSNAPNLKNTAVELYYTVGALPVEKRFRSFMTNGVASRLHGGTYEELFSGIEPGMDYYEVQK